MNQLPRREAAAITTTTQPDIGIGYTIADRPPKKI